MDESNQNSDLPQAGDQAQVEQGNAVAGGASGDVQSSGATSAPVASTSDHVADAPNGALPAVAQSASDTSSSVTSASRDVDIAADVPAETDHKGILAMLLADLEGIVHMGKSEIIAVVDRAKSLL